MCKTLPNSYNQATYRNHNMTGFAKRCIVHTTSKFKLISLWSECVIQGQLHGRMLAAGTSSWLITKLSMIFAMLFTATVQQLLKEPIIQALLKSLAQLMMRHQLHSHFNLFLSSVIITDKALRAFKVNTL